MDILELNYLDIDENDSYKEIIKKVLKKCFEIEKLENKNLYVNVVLTNAKNIKSINKEKLSSPLGRGGNEPGIIFC